MNINLPAKKKGIAFVRYEEEESARKALELNGQMFKGRLISVALADPKMKKNKHKDDFAKQGDRNVQSVTAFVPMAVKKKGVQKARPHAKLAVEESGGGEIGGGESKKSGKSQADFRKMMGL